MADVGNNTVHWLAAAQAGLPEARGRVLEDCRRYLLHVAQRAIPADLKMKGGVSDLVQETFLEAHRSFDQFHGQSAGELRAWLRRLLRNRAAKLGRQFRNAQKREIAREISLDDGASGRQRVAIASDSLSPSERAIGREQGAALQQALRRLPNEYQQVIALRYAEDRSFEEIGREMQRTGNAARLLWLRAIERLQQEMQRHGVS